MFTLEHSLLTFEMYLKRTSPQNQEEALDNKMAMLDLLVAANKDLMGSEDCENFVNDIMTLILVADNISKVHQDVLLFYRLVYPVCVLI